MRCLHSHITSGMMERLPLNSRVCVVISNVHVHKGHTFKFQYFVGDRRTDRRTEESCEFTRLEQEELNDQFLLP